MPVLKALSMLSENHNKTYKEQETYGNLRYGPVRARIPPLRIARHRYAVAAALETLIQGPDR
jgi:hypothetical protein